MNRRDFLQLLGASAILSIVGGCVRGQSKTTSGGKAGEPDILSSGGPFSYDYDGSAPLPRNEIYLAPRERTGDVPGQSPKQTPAQPAYGRQVTAYSRSRWEAETPRTALLNPMNGVNRITVHHEGNPRPNNDSTPAQVALSLRNIQSAHFRTMKAGDIGYHYIIDRQGMVWQGRDIRYQGAHTGGNNANNIGIMCLGNFNLQYPTGAQIASLERLTLALSTGYNIPGSRIYGHRELRSTACPGKHLFEQVRRIRCDVVRA